MVYIVSKTPIILHGFAIIYVAWFLMSLFREPLWATTMFEPTSCTDSKPMGNRILLTKRPPAPHANLQIFTFMYIAYINMYSTVSSHPKSSCPKWIDNSLSLSLSLSPVCYIVFNFWNQSAWTATAIEDQQQQFDLDSTGSGWQRSIGHIWLLATPKW